MSEEIFKITMTSDEDFAVQVNDGEKTIKCLTDWIKNSVKDKSNREAMDILFSVCVHLCASEKTGKFQKEFIDNLTIYANKYRNIVQQVAQKMS